jgi:hypothetical protein
MKGFLLIGAAVMLSQGCMNMQRVIINTSTPGAQITVVKRGEIRTRNKVVGVKVRSVEQFEDLPVVVGTAPLVYDFQRVEEGGSWGFGEIFRQDQKRVCQWLEIRATAPGQSSMQIIPVNGDDTSVFLQLQPVAPPVHAASSVLPPQS